MVKGCVRSSSPPSVGDPLGRIWQRILRELAELQDKAPCDQSGHVVNSISGQVYYRDTAFGARVFATEYHLSGQKEWLERAVAAVDALRRLGNLWGLDEPRWNRYGWHVSRGSLPATAMLLDALWVTEAQIGGGARMDNAEGLLSYLERCMVGPGLFAHDAVAVGTRPPGILNTTAMALVLMERLVTMPRVVGDVGKVARYVRDTRDRVYEGQRSDGFWPYVFPSVVQRMAFAVGPVRRLAARSGLVQSAVMGLGDGSVLFSDAVHNAYVLYFVLRSLVVRGWLGRRDREVVSRGWGAIRGRLYVSGAGMVGYDFSDEPPAASPRYCSFCSTSVYFIAMAVLAMLESVGMGARDQRQLSCGIARHVEANLLEDAGVYPCVKANEGPAEVVRNILPHVGESVAFRGYCLAEWLLCARRAEWNGAPGYAE